MGQHSPATRSGPTVVGLCAGKDCRRSREFDALKASLTGCTVIETRCLDICHGPVVVIEPLSNHPVVLSRLRAQSDVRALHSVLVDDAKLSSRLKKRRVLGSKRRAALRRAARSLRR